MVALNALKPRYNYRPVLDNDGIHGVISIRDKETYYTQTTICTK